MTLRISWSTEAEETTDGITSLTATEHILEFDAVTEETHSSFSEITEHTVETGESISDHKRANPRTIEITAFVTNTPLDTPPNSGPNTTSAVATIEGTDNGNVNTFSETFDRVSDVWGVLLDLQRGSAELTITTRYQIYENVQLVGFSVPRDTPEDAAVFELSLQEVFKAETRLVDVPVTREPRGQRKRKQNTAPVETTSPPVRQDDGTYTATGRLREIKAGRPL